MLVTRFEWLDKTKPCPHGAYTTGQIQTRLSMHYTQGGSSNIQSIQWIHCIKQNAQEMPL